MKKLQIAFLFITIMTFSACYTTGTAGRSGKVPPGQAKNARGAKSAKPYAPGQQKKN